jgi:amidase
MTDYTWDDAVELAALVRKGDASPTELVDLAIERCEAANPVIGAIVHERYEKARAEAKTLEAVAADEGGPFRGVPMLVKDLGASMADEPYTAGTRILKNLGYRSPSESFVARRLREAGFVILGRTKTPELGSTITTEPVAYGPARNPWNTSHSTGGSSGGSAAAVAAGCVPVAHASDGGGSIRIPASECGLVGLKPSRGRISKGPMVGEAWMGASTDGAVTRSVRDAAALLDVLVGYEVGDPVVAPPPARPFAAEVGADSGRLRIGVLDHPASGVDADAETTRAVASAAELLSSLGHRVEPAWPAALEETEFGEKFLTVITSYTHKEVRWFESLAGRPMGDDDLESMNLAMAHMGSGVIAAEYLETVDWLHAWSRRVLSWWHGDDAFDLLLSPVINGTPPPIGWLSDPEQGLPRLQHLLQYTSQFNITGQPAVSLPLHWSDDGLPVGVQLVAAYGREDVLLRVGAAAEAARPWAQRHPVAPQ